MPRRLLRSPVLIIVLPPFPLIPLSLSASLPLSLFLSLLSLLSLLYLSPLFLSPLSLSPFPLSSLLSSLSLSLARSLTHSLALSETSCQAGNCRTRVQALSHAARATADVLQRGATPHRAMALKVPSLLMCEPYKRTNSNTRTRPHRAMPHHVRSPARRICP
jgi:hypothetical protein